jgi:pimeloyl-ACP methyl ester carboxylesterase
MRHVTIEGRRLEVLSHPPAAPGAPWLVFLHEGLGAARQWRDFPSRLAAGAAAGTLVYSRWGYGGSEGRPRPWPIAFLEDEAAIVLPAILAEFGIERPVLFGHSDGGTIALMYAAAFPGAARGVIAEAAHVMLEEVGLTGIARVRQRYLDGELRAGLNAQHGAHTDDTVLGWTEVWLRPEWRGWDIRERLRTIRCPVLVVQGRDDEFGTLDQVDEILTGVGGPAESLVLDGCRHVPHREKAAEVIEACAAFIRRLGRDRRQ